MEVVFTDVTKCREIQRNQFRNDKVVETHIGTGHFIGNKVMAQKTYVILLYDSC